MVDDLDRYQVALGPDGFGSLRDISVFAADERDWQRALDFLRASSLPLDFSVDGVPMELPGSIAEIFAIRQRAIPSLLVDLAGVRLASYFFAPSVIEFDFDPRDVTTAEQGADVLAFMRRLGEELGKPVVLADESTPGDPIVRFDPALQDVR